MIEAMEALLRTWDSRSARLGKRGEEAERLTTQYLLIREGEVLDRCRDELRDAIVDLRPAPLTEGATRKLYKWADRMVAILDLMEAAQACGEADSFAELATPEFMDDLHDLFKQLADRQRTR